MAPRRNLFAIIRVSISARSFRVKIEHVPTGMCFGELLHFNNSQILAPGFKPVQNDLRLGRDNDVSNLKAFSASVQSNNEFRASFEQPTGL